LRVSNAWDRRIARAGNLAATAGPAGPLLVFYERLLRSQKAVAGALTRGGAVLSGSLIRDLDLLAQPASALVEAVSAAGPDALAAEGRALLESGASGMSEALLTYWRAPSDRVFFAKAILQPYGECLAAAGVCPVDRGPAQDEGRCPFCGGAAQLSMLDPAMSEAGGGRRLLCGMCLTLWAFRRVRCPHCGEDDERKLSYFSAPEFDHVRVDACDSCRRYLKTVDLTRLGVAVPMVDEVAAAVLDAWARERGYEKIELNLVGL
jgi:FdhE protein